MLQNYDIYMKAPNYWYAFYLLLHGFCPAAPTDSHIGMLSDISHWKSAFTDRTSGHDKTEIRASWKQEKEDSTSMSFHSVLLWGL